jgi:hypothetical protein
MVKQNPKINEKKNLSKILWGEKWKEVKKMLLFLLPKATKHGTIQGPPSLEPSINHQVVVFPCLLLSSSL